MATGLKRFLFSITLMALLLAGGMMIAGWLHATKPPAQRTGELPSPPLVKLRTVAEEDIQEYFTGYGSARAEADAVLAAEVTGVVVEVAKGLNDGAHVEAAQLLVRIDDRQYRQQLVRAEAVAANLEARIGQLDVEKANVARLAAVAEQEVEVNRSELNRLAGLFEKELAARKEYDFARLAYQRSRRQLLAYRNQIDLIVPRRAALDASRTAQVAGVQLAKLDVERCRITAPFAGEVVWVSVDVGDHLLVGGEILRLISTRLIEVPIELPASVRPRVEVGTHCRLEADSMPGMHWDGVVARIAPMTDAQSRTFAAYVDVDNDMHQTPLVPGCFLAARVEGPMLRRVLAVPRGVVVGDHVYVVNDDVVHARAIRVDRYVGEQAVVTGDLKPGDQLVLTNLDVLYDGAEVRVESHQRGTNPTPGPGGNGDARQHKAVTAGGER